MGRRRTSDQRLIAANDKEAQRICLHPLVFPCIANGSDLTNRRKGKSDSNLLIQDKIISVYIYVASPAKSGHLFAIFVKRSVTN
jgi:hypothetical protein